MSHPELLKSSQNSIFPSASRLRRWKKKKGFVDRLARGPADPQTLERKGEPRSGEACRRMRDEERKRFVRKFGMTHNVQEKARRTAARRAGASESKSENAGGEHLG